MIDLIDKVIDRIIQIRNWKKNKQAEYFKRVVEEIQQNFELIHTDYINSFDSYRQGIKDSREDFSEIIDRIKIENLKAHSIRNKIFSLEFEMSENEILDFNKKENLKTKLLKKYFYSLKKYLVIDSYDSGIGNIDMQMFRTTLMENIKVINQFNDNEIKKVLSGADSIANEEYFEPGKIIKNDSGYFSLSDDFLTELDEVRLNGKYSLKKGITILMIDKTISFAQNFHLEICSNYQEVKKEFLKN